MTTDYNNGRAKSPHHHIFSFPFVELAVLSVPIHFCYCVLTVENEFATCAILKYALEVKCKQARTTTFLFCSIEA